MNPNTRKRYLLLTVVALTAFSVSPALSQIAPAASVAAQTNGAPIKLDPFSVSAESDVGFVAANALAGGRIATALKDTPVAYSVLTSEFLEAFNINDAGKAADFSVNSVKYENDGLQGTLGNTTVVIKIRGQTANTPTHNFFPYAIAADSYNVDRMDFARGANASLFGAGGSAGTINTVSKQALTTRKIQETRFQVGSFNRYRFTADVNQPINDRVAVRANVLWSEGDTFREREWEFRKGITLAATFNVTPKFSIRAEYEYRTTDKTSGTNRSKDDTSAWDGKFMPSGLNSNMTTAQMAVAGVTRQVQRFVRDAENPRAAYNTRNMFQTKGARYNASNTNYLNGKPLRSVNVNIGGISMTEAWDHSDRFAASYAGSPFFMLPGRTFTPTWDYDRDYPSGIERGEDLSVYFTYRPFEGFFTELSGNVNQVERWTEYPAAGGMYNMQVDINRNKANGDPNPYFLHPYSENTPFAFTKNPGYHNVNLQTAYVKETRWGTVQAGVMAGIQNLRQENRQEFFLLPLMDGVIPGDDFRSYFAAGDRNIQSVYTRQYTDLRGKLPSTHPTLEPLTVSDPLTGTRASIAPKWYIQPNRSGSTDDVEKRYQYVQAVVNLNLFKNRLVLIGAVRRDFTVLQDDIFTFSEDMPAGWRGETYTHRPKAPDDYWALTYQPKDAGGNVLLPPINADARPRAVVNKTSLALAQYANDRFRDDYSPPDIVTGVNTRTFGAVVNLTRWLGVYANDSTTFDLNAGSQDANFNLIPPTSSHSYDAGVRFTLPNGKVSASLGWYRAFQQNRTFGVGFNFRQNVTNMSNAPVIGDLSEGGRNIRGLPVFPGLNVTSTQTSETDGYELEVTANLTRNWRFIANSGLNQPMQKDVMPDMPGWFAAKDSVLRQIMADAGITIDSSNQAFINPAYDDPTKIHVEHVQLAADAWNNYQSNTIPSILSLASLDSREVGGPELTANIATDYRFTSGKLNGLRAGIAINYRGRQILGGTATDTIPDPANPTKAIPAPYASATNYLMAGGYAKGTINLSYTMRLKEGGRRYAPKTVQFDLAVDNAFGMTKPIIEGSRTGNSTANGIVLAPRDNDISNPSAMSIAGAYNFQPPRNYMLTAKLNF